jgi:hypothetical protein
MMHKFFENLLRGAFGLFFLFCFGGGLLCIWLQIRAFVRAKASRAWPETRGVVTKAAVQEIVTTDDDTPSRSYMPRLEYSYLVAGKRQSHSRIRFGTGIYSTGFRFYPRRLMRPYSVGQAVKVFYDPADPSVAVLEPGKTGREHLFMAALLFGFAIVIWVFVLREIL